MKKVLEIKSKLDKLKIERIIISNGSDWFFEDDATYGWNNMEEAVVMMVRISSISSSITKVIKDIEIGGEYKQKIISSYNPNNL